MRGNEHEHGAARSKCRVVKVSDLTASSQLFSNSAKDRSTADPCSQTLPPSPMSGSPEFIAEIAEIYQMALCRDWPIAAFMDGALVSQLTLADGTGAPDSTIKPLCDAQDNVRTVAARLSALRWFKGDGDTLKSVTASVHERHRLGKTQCPSTLFRGAGEDPWPTPFLSQVFILAPKDGIDPSSEQREDASLRLWPSLGDLADCARNDHLCRSLLTMALGVLSQDFAPDTGSPYQDPFASDFLALFREVSNRAVASVDLQKLTVHRRLRPEAAGAVFLSERTIGDPIFDRLANRSPTDFGTVALEPALGVIVHEIRRRVAQAETSDPKNRTAAKWVLTMTHPDGSSILPPTGAGHATITAACVTLLKALYAMTDPAQPSQPVYLVARNALARVPYGAAWPQPEQMLSLRMPNGLTLEGELNKLIWNIAIAPAIAGLQYYSDYIEPALIGEAITIATLCEDMAARGPNAHRSITVPLLVSRCLPECLLRGPNTTIARSQKVAGVTILSDGSLIEATPTPRPNSVS